MPIVTLATTEMMTVVRNGENGYVETRIENAVAAMLELLRHPGEAQRLGENARRYAEERFNIERFVKDWMEVFRTVTQ